MEIFVLIIYKKAQANTQQIMFMEVKRELFLLTIYDGSIGKAPT